MVRLRLSIGPSRYSSFRYSWENCAHEILPSWTADRRRSLRPRLGIQTPCRDAGRPRPRNRVTKIRRLSVLGLIALQTLFVFNTRLSLLRPFAKVYRRVIEAREIPASGLQSHRDRRAQARRPGAPGSRSTFRIGLYPNCVYAMTVSTCRGIKAGS